MTVLVLVKVHFFQLQVHSPAPKRPDPDAMVVCEELLNDSDLSTPTRVVQSIRGGPALPSPVSPEPARKSHNTLIPPIRRDQTLTPIPMRMPLKQTTDEVLCLPQVVPPRVLSRQSSTQISDDDD